MKNFKHIILSRTDSIGDVILSFPLAGLLKQIFPGVKISFLGQSYTKPVVECCQHIDTVYCWDEIKNKPEDEIVAFFKSLHADGIIHVFPRTKIAEAAKKAGIPFRIGTSRRIFHLLTCNELVNLPRKNSDLHEAQLNIKLLKPFEYDLDCPREDVFRFYGFSKTPDLNTKFEQCIDKKKFNLILHPKSKGSAREWGLNNFSSLINELPEDKFNIIITGTQQEKELIGNDLPFGKNNVVDLCGKLNLSELIAIINHCDGLLAASTGPLHIAAILGKHALGIYAPIRPIHPGRWAPLGPKAKVFVQENNCNDCRKTKDCPCIKNISVSEIREYLEGLVIG